MATLPTLQPGTLIAASSTEATLVGTEPVLEELGSANDSTYLRQTTDNTTLTVDAWFELEDMPLNFGSMDTLAVQLRYNNSATLSLNYWGDITAQVFQSDGTTALCNEVQVVGFPSTNGNGDASIDTGNTPATSSSVSLNTGLNTTADDTVWNGARLRITYDITKQKGGDAGITYQITAGELTGTYTAVTVWTANLTGQEATTESTSPTTSVDDSVTVSGQEAATEFTSPTTFVDDSITVTGEEFTTEVGTPEGIVGVIISGEESVSEFTNPTTVTDDSVELSGQEAATEFTSPTGAIDDSITVSGEESATESGALEGVIGVILTGAEYATESGDFGLAVSVESSSIQSNFEQGAFDLIITDESVDMTGEQSNSELGSLIPVTIKSIVGHEVAIERNDITTYVDDVVTVPAQEVVTEQGQFTLKIDDNVVLNGVESASEAGTLSYIVSTTQVLTGLQIATQIPTELVAAVIPLFTETIQSFSPSAILEFVTLDLAVAPWNDTIYYFHNGTNEFNADVIWQGQQYSAFPIFLEGFESTSQGSVPRPVLRIANISGLVSVLLRQGGLPGSKGTDLTGAKITRKRTFARYLDSANFINGNATADPNVYFPDDIYYINRKTQENIISIEFELVSALDLDNVRLPRRQIVQNTCQWVYKSAECGWRPDPTTGPFYDANNNPTGVEEDKCGKTLSACETRYGTNAEVLPYGGFPGAGLINY